MVIYLGNIWTAPQLCKYNLNYGKKRCKIGLLKNGAKLRTKFTFQKDAQLDKSMT